MNAEHELRVLEVNPEDIKAKILDLGGKEVEGRTLQRRITYDVVPINKDKWLRLRTNGKKTTLAVKHVTGQGVSGTKEIEVEVNDFETAARLVDETGLIRQAYQENYRSLYELGEAEIMLDEWPLIPPYIEVEAKTPDIVVATLQKLGFDLKQATGLDVSSVYEQVYKIDVNNMQELKFDS